MVKQRASLATAITLAASALAVASVGEVEAFSVGMTSHNNKANPIDASSSRKRNIVRVYNQKNNNNNNNNNQGNEETSGASQNNHRPTNSFGTFLVAAAVTAATLDPTTANAEAKNDLDLVSPGMAVIETKITDSGKLLQSTETTLNELADTVLLNAKNRNELGDSLKRIQSDIRSEISSVEAWKEVTKILQDYGIDLQKETSIVVRPPADIKRAIGDVANRKVSLLVNGEIVQIDLEYNKGTNTKENLQDGKSVQPDDEWVLRIKGYKGFDPNALPIPQRKANLLFDYERKPPPLWWRKWDNYWHEPLSGTNPFHNLAKTHGDAIVIGGTTAIALSYAVSYAYYLDQIEQEELAAKKKQEEIAAKKKKAAAAAKKKKKQDEEMKEQAPKKKGLFGRKKQEAPTPEKSKTEAAKTENSEPNDEPKPKVEEKETAKDEKEETTTEDATDPEPPKAAVDESPKEGEPKKEETPTPTPPSIESSEATTQDETLADDIDEIEEEDDIQVSIDFDEDGKVVITAINGKSVTDSTPKRGGPIAFAQALWLPWMGFFVSSKLDSDNRSKPIKFAQSLLFPWAGILFRKEQSVSEVTIETKDKK